ncbi:MAG TPA: hypothetical protein VGH01_10925 [Jatrophihabitantaceae bacterium]|jgi:hypothetical protein
MSFPSELTNKQWQKNKGLFAKAKPTGIGEALTAMEKEFNGSGFMLDPAKLGTETYDPILFEKRLAQFDKVMQTQAKKIDAAAGTVQTKITAAKSTFAGNKAVLAVLTKLESDLANFRAGIKLQGAIATKQRVAIFDEFKKHLKGSAYWKQTVEKKLAASTEGHRQEVLGDIKRLEADPRLELVHEMWGSDGAARTLRTTPRLWDQILVKNFPELTKMIRPGSAMADFNQLPWVDTVGDEPGNTATKKIQLGLKGATDTASVTRALTTFALQYSNSLMKYSDFVKALAEFETVLKKYSK